MWKAGIAGILLVAIGAAYWQVGSNDFIEYDDQAYLLDNPIIRSGMTLKGLVWAFTAPYAANWHPLTWLSHMLDVQLFGLEPGRHHLVNVAFHAANTLLLFHLLCRLTGALWRSALVAMLFALHPLHVESVAWVAERKDVLSTLFWLVTLCLYARYTQKRVRHRYLMVIVAFALGLMAKPMLVTLPLVMLLLDYWPLGRIGNWRRDDGKPPAPEKCSPASLIREKIPLLALAVASSALTIYAQQKGAAMTTLTNSPLPARIANALTSYVTYLGKAAWPQNLSVFYPFPETISLGKTLAASAFLAVVTAVAIRQRRRCPYLLVGWLWYLLTLVPVIGIVRVGLQSMADRYTYIPLTGIFVATVWGAADSAAEWKLRRAILSAMAVAIFTACLLTTRRQVSYWQSTATLATHALAATRGNYVAHCLLGRRLEVEGKLQEALAHFDEAVTIAPWYEYAKIHQALILNNQGRVDAAIFKYNETILQNPTSVRGHINLGILLALQDRFEEARENFDIALKFAPGSAIGHYNMGLTLSRMGRLDEAVEQYGKALDSDPSNAECLNNLGIALAEQGKVDEAIGRFSEALNLNPAFHDARNNLELARRKSAGTPPQSP